MWGLLLDLDGTLALTNALHETVWRSVLSEYGVSLSSERYATEISGRSNQESVAPLLPELERSRAKLVWERKELRFRERAKGLTTLAGLREQPNSKWLALSETLTGYAERSLGVVVTHRLVAMT